MTHCPPPATWVLLGLLLAGCEPALGPTTTLTGRITLRGQPVPRGWLEFMPIDGTTGHLRSARIAADGSFCVEKVAVGRVAIRLVGTPLPQTESIQINTFLEQVRQASLIHRTIAPPPTPPLQIELAKEATGE